MEQVLTVEFGPSRSERFGSAVAETHSGPGECSELEPGRYRVRFVLRQRRRRLHEPARLPGSGCAAGGRAKYTRISGLFPPTPRPGDGLVCLLPARLARRRPPPPLPPRLSA